MSHVVSLFDIRLQTPLPYVVILQGSNFEAEDTVLNGSVVLCLNNSISVKSIVFRFYGVNKVKWTEVIMTSSRTPMERSQKQKSIVFERKISFLPFQGTKTIGKGNYEYPFKINIPGDIPESIEPYRQEELMARLVYKMKVTIERPGFSSNIVHKKIIRIIRTIPLSSLDFVYTMFVEDTWLNKVEYNINIPTKIYELGGLIPISMRFVPLIKNIKIAKIICSLREYITLKIVSGYHGIPSKYDTTRQISTIKIKNLPEEENEWVLEKTMNIPNSLSSCIQNCDVKHIKVRHKLKVIVTLVNPDGHISELRTSLPVILYISPSVFADSNSYNYHLARGFQLPSYDNHVYDRIWDGVSSIDINPSLTSEITSIQNICNSTNAEDFYNINEVNTLCLNLSRNNLLDESHNVSRDQENENDPNYFSNRYITSYDLSSMALQNDSSCHTSVQHDGSESHAGITRTSTTDSNEFPHSTTASIAVQSNNRLREDNFIDNLSIVPSYRTANRPVFTAVAPISQSLPTYEASVHVSHNTNQVEAPCCPMQNINNRMHFSKLQNHRFFKIFFVRH